MFEDYLLLLNFILNVIFIASKNLCKLGNFVLGVYGVYRSEDEDTLNLIHNEDIPGFVKLFF